MLYPSRFTSDPFEFLRRMSRDFDRTFGTPTPAFPAVNLWQNDEAVVITAELPGVEPADIDVTVKDNVLTVSGERNASDSDDDDDIVWHRRERSFGPFSRAIRLPFVARDEQVEARCADGVLRIVVARPEEDKPRQIEIKAV
jgi:HSP20 family protein